MKEKVQTSSSVVQKGKLAYCLRKENLTSQNLSQRKNQTPGGTARGERGNGGEEGGLFGGNMVGGNPVEVTAMKVASLLRSGREVLRGASRRTHVTPCRRCERASCLEGQVRMECLNVSGSRWQRGQEVSASGVLQVGRAAS